MRSRTAVAVIALLGLSAGSAVPAVAGEKRRAGKVTAGTTGGVPTIGVAVPGSPGSGSSSGGSGGGGSGGGGGGGGGITTGAGYSCTWYPIDANGQPVLSQPINPFPPDGVLAWLRCSGPQTIDGPRTRQSGGTLAASDIARRPLPAPVVATNPAAVDTQLVGVPTWFWVPDAAALPPAVASVPGASATLIATPKRLSLDTGEGIVNCPDLGRAYDPARPASSQSTRCKHAFTRSSADQPGGVHTIVATLWWEVTWSADNGTSGRLEALPSRSTFSLAVAEAQALVVKPRP